MILDKEYKQEMARRYMKEKGASISESLAFIDGIDFVVELLNSLEDDEL
jgi:hypothetical protein